MSEMPAMDAVMARSVWKSLGRVRLTLMLTMAILATTAMTGTMTGGIDDELLARWGFGFQDFQSGDFVGLLTAPFQVYRPYMLVTSLGMLVVFLGGAEIHLGTRRSSIIAVASHVSGFMGAMVVLWLLDVADVPGIEPLLSQRDVGCSNIAVGALGACLWLVRASLRRFAIVLAVATLIVLFAMQTRIWNFEHAIAFAVGLAAGRRFTAAS